MISEARSSVEMLTDSHACNASIILLLSSLLLLLLALLLYFTITPFPLFALFFSCSAFSPVCGSIRLVVWLLSSVLQAHRLRILRFVFAFVPLLMQLASLPALSRRLADLFTVCHCSLTVRFIRKI